MKSQTHEPVISIVLGTRSRLPFLKETIASIRNNDIELPYEIIVVEGGSVDGSMEWLSKQSDIFTIDQHERGLEDGVPPEKQTWGYFMNLGFKSARGKYILMISDDCILHPNAVMNGYRLFEAELENRRKVGAIAFYWRNFPEQEKYWVGLTLGKKMFVNHGLYLREALKDVGWIDEHHYRFYHADGDLCLKLWQAGYETIESPDSYVEHCTHLSRHVTSNKDDWETYLGRWKGIFFFPEEEYTGGWIEKHYDDPHHTYEVILRTSPKIRILYLKKCVLSTVQGN